MFSTDEPAPPAPPVDPAVFDRVRAALDAGGPLAAVDRLCEDLEAAGDYPNLFYALLMRTRVELGVPPFPTGPASDLPDATHDAYEESIRRAGRRAGAGLLARGDLPKAWTYFRLIGDPEPVRQALADYAPGPDADVYPAVEVAWQQGVLPQKGFDLILDRHGICSAITMVHAADLSTNPDLRGYCVRRLVRALHAQLADRLRFDLAGRGVEVPAGAAIPELVAGRDELFADELYHVDTSHLSSVVQLAMQLPAGPDLDLAGELCAYGERLAPSLRGDNDPPFENTYRDYGVYLRVLAGRDVDAGLAHFRAKAVAGAAGGYQFPAEVLVNLLLAAGRPAEALAAARELLPGEERPRSCPGVAELARRVGDFAALSEAARAQGDPVGFLAGLIAGRDGSPSPLPVGERGRG